MKLATHNQRFHLDEVTSTAILKKIFPDATLKRTRDPKDFEEADIVYDVSGVYDPTRGRYDHHQRGFTHTFSEAFPIKLSSAGLIYKHYHKQLFKYYGLVAEDWIVDEVYEEYFKYVDACDNGVDLQCTIVPRTMVDLVSCFNVQETGVKEDTKNGQLKNEVGGATTAGSSARVHSSCTVPLSDTLKDFVLSDNYNDYNFLCALNLISIDMDNYFRQKKQLVEMVSANHDLIRSATGDILVIGPDRDLSREALFILEKIWKKDFLFIVYDSSEHVRMYGTIKERNSYAIKVPLCLEWGGLREEELRARSGIEGSTFVHSSGFTGGAKDLKSALEMCRRSIKKSQE